MLRFVEGTDPLLRKQFVRYGIVESELMAGGISLKRHLDDFTKAMTTEGKSYKHIEETKHRVEKEINEGDQGGEEPFVDMEDANSLFIVKRKNPGYPKAFPGRL